MKVGKALYNILGSSKEIQENFPFNTTDYAPSSTELITNGDFSATGTDLLADKNGNFESGSANWTTDVNTGSVTFANDQVQIISDGSSATGITQNILTIDKSYKVTIDVASITGKFKILLGTLLTEVNSSGVQTFYGVAAGATFYIYRVSDENVDVVINSVTVKEIGEDWTVDPTSSWTFENSYVIGTGNNTSNYLKQNFTITNGKYYKFTYEVLQNSLSGAPVGNEVALSSSGGFQLDGGSLWLNNSVGVHTIYILATDAAATYTLKIGISGQNLSGTIQLDNLLLKEMVVTKIFPEIAPTGINAPYIVYSVVSNQPSESKEDNGAIDTASVEVYSFQDTYNKAIDLGVDVRAALKRVNGTYNTIDIQSIDYTNEQMDVNEKRDLWASIQDYEIRVKN